MSEENYFSLGDFAHSSEKNYFDYLKKQSLKNCFVIHSVYIPADGLDYEVDFIVICPQKIFLIEQKCWGDEIQGNDRKWKIYYQGVKKFSRPSPYLLLQKKQRFLKKYINIFNKNSPLITSIIVVGDSKREIQLNINGVSQNSILTPQESLKIIKQELNGSKYENENARKIYDYLTKNLREISEIKIKSVLITIDAVNYISFEYKIQKLTIKEEKGELFYSENIQIKCQTESNVDTEKLEEYISVLQERLEYFLYSAHLLRSKSNEGIKEIVLTWIKTVETGNLEISYLSPFLQLKTNQDIYKNLSGGFFNVEKDSLPLFKIFRESELKPKSIRENFFLLIGKIGMGKTSQLCRIAVESLEDNVNVYLINSQLKVPINFNVKNSILIIDNFFRINPQDIITLSLLAEKGKNIIYCALREELRDLFYEKVKKETKLTLFPWKEVNLPNLSYIDHAEMFNSVKQDWNIFFVKEAIPTILLQTNNNPSIFSDYLKNPESKIGPRDIFDTFFLNKQISFPAIYKKYMRLLYDLHVYFPQEKSLSIIKSIYTLVFYRNYFIEHLWDLIREELTLLPLDHKLLSVIFKKRLIIRDTYLDTWNTFFQIFNTKFFESFNYSPYPGEYQNFMVLYKEIQLEEWKKEIQTVINQLYSKLMVNQKSYSLSIIQKASLSSLAIIKNLEWLQFDEKKYLLDSNLNDFENLKIAYILATNLKNEFDENYFQKYLFFMDIVKITDDIETIYPFVISLRNFVEKVEKTYPEKLIECTKLYLDNRDAFLRFLEKKLYLMYQPTYIIELYRIVLKINLERDEKIINKYIYNAGLFRSFLISLKTYYDLIHQKQTLSFIEIIKNCHIMLLESLWNIFINLEEIHVYKIIITAFQKEEKYLDAILISLGVMNVLEKNNRSVLTEYFPIIKEISEKIEIPILQKSINQLALIHDIFHPDFEEGNEQDLSEIIETYSSIITLLKDNEFQKAKKLFELSKKELEEKIPKTYRGFEKLFSKTEEEQNSNDLEEINGIIDQLKLNNDNRQIIELTNNLPDPLTNYNDFYAYVVWRERGTAFRKEGHKVEAFGCYIVSFALSYFNSTGEAFRTHLLGQIAGISSKSNRLLYFTLTILIGRRIYPETFAYRLREPKIPYLEWKDFTNKDRSYESKALTQYQASHLLAQDIAGMGRYKQAKRLANLALEDVIHQNYREGEVFCYMVLSRIANEQENSEEEELYYNKAKKIKDELNNDYLQGVLNSRKMKFDNPYEEFEQNDGDVLENEMFDIPDQNEEELIFEDEKNESQKTLNEFLDYNLKNEKENANKLFDEFLSKIEEVKFEELIGILEFLNENKFDEETFKIIDKIKDWNFTNEKKIDLNDLFENLLASINYNDYPGLVILAYLAKIVNDKGKLKVLLNLALKKSDGIWKQRILNLNQDN